MSAKAPVFSVLLLPVLVVAFFVSQAEAASFRILGSSQGSYWPSGFTSVSGVSDDGTTAVGTSFGHWWDVGPPRSSPRRWSASGERLPTAYIDAEVSDVSADGSVLVGTNFFWAPDGSRAGYEAVQLGPDGSVVSLGHLSDGSFSSRASGVSGDGSVVVGQSDSESGRRAFRWTQSEGMIGLATLPGDALGSATAISADGQVTVGWSDLDPSYSTAEAVRFSADGTAIGLGRLRDHPCSWAQGVSGDGSVVVGLSGRGMQDGSYPIAGVPGDEAFLWTETEGMVGLGYLPGHDWSQATAVSTDGRFVVGSSAALATNGEYILVGGREAFIWDAKHGMRNLKDLLIDQYGLELPDWLLGLGTPTGISADGRVIVGNGGGAWVVAIPEPSVLVLTVIGLLGLAVYAVRRRDAQPVGRVENPAVVQRL